jgi:predicted tellurium resistance membrane protein TerC
MEFLADPQVWLAFITLTALEIVLGIDNIIFLAILVGRLPPEQREKARVLGLGFAMLTRIALLFSLAWLMSFTRPLLTVLEYEFSLRDIVLILGGLFLLFKSTLEIHNSLEGEEHEAGVGSTSFLLVVTQIAIIDIVFSLDSVITAVGLVEHIEVMVAAIIIAVLVMMLAARTISDFVDQHPTIKMLALSFLILIGVALIGEGFDLHIPKGYIYFAMAFSVVVELLNMRVRKGRAPVHLRKAMVESSEN